MNFSLKLAQDLIEVEAGATTPLSIEVQNKGTESDRYELEIEGIDSEWKAIPVPVFVAEPGEVHSEKVFLKPPRASESVAGNYPFVVKVRSLVTGEQRTVQGVVKLKPFHHLTMDINPKKGSISPTIKRNSFEVTIVNLGNTEHTLQLIANDPEDDCAFEFEHEQVTLGPGQQREVQVRANPRSSPVLSSGKLIGFSVTARSIDSPTVAASTQAQLERRSLLSPTSLAVGVLAVLLLTAWFLMMPKPPGVTLSVSPLHATSGDTVTIRWNAHDATRVVITAGKDTLVDGAELSGSYSYKAKEPGRISLVAVASKDGKSSSPETKALDVDAAPVLADPVIESFDVSSKRIRLGTSFVMSWKVSDSVAKLAISPVKDDLDPALQQFAFTPTQTGIQDYTLVAYNKEGKSVRSRPIRVEVYEESDAVILWFSADPSTVPEEESKTTLSWQVNPSAVRVVLQADGGPIVPVENTDKREVAVSAKTTYTLTATDAKGRTVSRKVVVNFRKLTPPPQLPESGGMPPLDPPSKPASTGGNR